jgi:isopenicillin N synthase-like dioxygenase
VEVKVCSMKSESFSKDFMDSIINTGFAVLTDHDVNFDLIKNSQNEWRKFFLSEKAQKARFINKENHNMGYKGFGSEKAVGAKVSDLKEFFHWRPGEAIPLPLIGYSLDLFWKLEFLGQKALYIIDNHLGGSNNFQLNCRMSEKTILRSLYYPPITGEIATDAVRSAQHEDINFITFLVASSSSGLQVLDKTDKWHDVPYEENSIVCNVGDMMQLASNGLYRSTTHRVKNPEDPSIDRISMPFFIHPNPDMVLAPGITAKQFLEDRIDKIYMLRA